MKRNFLKVSLDVSMTLLLLLMYKKMAINMEFHEIGGLIVFGLFIVHMLINRKWITGVSKRLFDKTLPAKTRLGYILDFLLLICMTFIIVSGITMSKTIFPGMFNGGMFMKMGHYFASAVVIIIVGIHIGLHWSFIKGVFGKIIKLPSAITKPLGIICLAAILLFGSYSMATSSFSRWLTGPFTVTAMTNDGMQQKGDRPEGTFAGGARPQKGGGPEGMKDGELPGSSVSFGAILALIASFGSITFVFSVLTAMIEKILKRKKHPAAVQI